jgi:metal-responsive CopG/Arc/MetJ family transcriptional regulator
MRVRTSLILEESLIEKIDEIAVEKKRRSLIIETALREFIERHERKKVPEPAPRSKGAAETKR